MPTRAGDASGFRQTGGGAFYGKANSAAAAVTEIVLIAFAEFKAPKHVIIPTALSIDLFCPATCCD